MDAIKKLMASPKKPATPMRTTPVPSPPRSPSHHNNLAQFAGSFQAQYATEPILAQPRSPLTYPAKSTHDCVCSFVHSLARLGGPGNLHDNQLDAEEERKTFLDEVLKTKASLAQRNRGLLKPRGGFIQYWDMVTACALFFTIVVTPFEVGMDLPTTTQGGLAILFWANQMVTLIFVSDIFINFVLPTPKGQVGGYERRHAILAKNYFTSWFVLDVVTIVPFDIFSLAGLLSASARSVKLLRVARLFKLVKVLRASSIIQRWEHTVALPSSRQSVLTYAFLAMVLLHWFACFWALVPRLQPRQTQSYGVSQERMELRLAEHLDVPTEHGFECNGCFTEDSSTRHFCESPCLTVCEREILAELTGEAMMFIRNNENWLCRAVEDGLLKKEALSLGGAPWHVYAASVLVSMMQLVGGVSTIVPMNTTEYIFFFVAIIVGAVLFAAVQGIICGVVTNGDPDETRWKQNNDALNFMMKDTGVPREERMKVRYYFAKSKKLFKRRSYGTLIDNCLSTEMQGDVRYLISHDVFHGVWWLRDLDRQFLEDLSIRLRREAFAPKESISGDKLNILTYGMASREGAFKTPGMWWGDIFLTSHNLRDTTPAQCLLYCECARLTRYDLVEVAEEYPEAKRQLRLSSVQQAMERTVTLIALTAKAEMTAPYKSKVNSPTSATSGLQGNGLPVAPPLPAKPSVVEASEVLRQKVHMRVGGPWREVEYSADGTPIGIITQAQPGSSSTNEEEATLAELLKAPPGSKDQILARMVFETNHKVEKINSNVQQLMQFFGAHRGSFQQEPPLDSLTV